MPSIIIPLIPSRHGIELKYCLRSIEKFAQNIGDIFLIGHKPDWVQNVIHIPYTDSSLKQANIRGKILAACSDARVSDNFLFTNDDIFLLRSVDAARLPYYYSGSLHQVAEKAAKVHALGELQRQGLPVKMFDIHTPIVYNKQMFAEAMAHFSEWCSIKSTYANYWRIEGEEMKDLKINSALRYQRIVQALEKRLCFSVGDYGLNADMLRVLDELFPIKSKYERPIPTFPKGRPTTH